MKYGKEALLTNFDKKMNIIQKKTKKPIFFISGSIINKLYYIY